MNSSTYMSGISVSGEGTVSLPPDTATLSVGVETRVATVEEARSQAAAAMDALLARLNELGIEKKDIKTQWVNIGPEYRPRTGRSNWPEQIEAYRVSNLLSVTVADLDNVSRVIDGATDAAGDAVRLHGIEFKLKEPEAAVRQAQELAVKDARTKAEHLAALSGVTAGKPISIQESGGGHWPYDLGRVHAQAMMAEYAVPTPVEPGETTVTVNVEIMYAIE